MEHKEDFKENPDPITAEIHTGERVLENVRNLLLKDQAWYSDIKEAHVEKADQNKAAWQELVNQLPEKEREAFIIALAQGLEDLYYTHYNAARRMTDSVEV